MTDEYDDAVKRLMEMTKAGFGGSPNPSFVSEISRLANVVMGIAGDSYINEKARSMVRWVEIACSSRKHAPWGLDKVEHFAFEDAYRLQDGPVGRQ